MGLQPKTAQQPPVSAWHPILFSLETTFPHWKGSAHFEFYIALSLSSRLSSIYQSLMKATTCNYLEHKHLSSQKKKTIPTFIGTYTAGINTFPHLIQQIPAIPLHTLYSRNELALICLQNLFKITCPCSFISNANQIMFLYSKLLCNWSWGSYFLWNLQHFHKQQMPQLLLKHMGVV